MLFYDGFGFVINIFVIEVDISSSDDWLQNMADDDGYGGGYGDDEPVAIVMEPKDVEIFEGLANHLNHDDILFGRPR